MQIPSVSDRYSATEVRECYASGCWSRATFTDLLVHQAQVRGDKTFVTDDSTAYTYAELRDHAIRLANGLRERGIGAGDRVAVQLPNWAEFAVVAAALAQLGAIMVPIMPGYRRDEVGHVLADAQISAVVTAAAFRGFDYLQMYRDLASTSPALHTIVVVRDDDAAACADAAVTTLAAVTTDVDPAEQAAAVDADAPYVIVYTSGTSARPKGCVHTFNTYASGARSLITAFAFTTDDVAFSPSPVTHTTGLVTGILLPLLTGAATHLMAEWEPVRGLGERVCCYVVPADPAEPTLDALRTFLEERGVAVQKAPERLEVLTAMPTTATGKIQKHLLRQDIARKIDASTSGAAQRA